MCRLGIADLGGEGSDWIDVDEWECKQKQFWYIIYPSILYPLSYYHINIYYLISLPLFLYA